MVLLLAVWSVILMDGTALHVTKECHENEYQVHTREGPKCCQKCHQHNPNQPCPGVNSLVAECRCNQGYACFSASCTKCTQLPNCTRGQQLKKTGDQYSTYNYICEKCPEGTFSEVENGICKLVEVLIIPTVNTKNNQKTSPPGIQTHGKKLTTPIRATESIFNNNSAIVLYTALVVFILLLFTIFIHLLIWKMKTTSSTKNAGIPFTSQMIVTMSTKEDADSWSCQYPEEEHGDGSTEKCAC
ncbi:tumor necrosis factor receptor superfamily member 18 [Mixophyes fleayi]|uniref:tumor necrosis factor receptor superfamily member 18 n=1 Tax=Mixophyes fleayi TaxID=3061075 RepID=UPI003F4DCF0C